MNKMWGSWAGSGGIGASLTIRRRRPRTVSRPMVASKTPPKGSRPTTPITIGGPSPGAAGVSGQVTSWAKW